MIIKWTVYTTAPLLNSSFASVHGNYFSFRYQSRVLGLNWTPPSTRRKLVRGCHPYKKYTHIVDHMAPSLIKYILLWPLMLNFLSATVSSLLPQVSCPFQKMSTNILWRYKTECIHSLTTWRARDFNPFFLVEGQDYVALGLLYVSSYPCKRINIVFTKNQMSQ